MKNKFFSKFGNTLRRAFCGMLCLVIVLQCAPISHAVLPESFKSYHWTKINNLSELERYSGIDSTGSAIKLIDKTSDKSRTSDKGWFKVLIGYTVNGKDYFFSGDSMCGEDDRECISAVRVIPKYGIDFTKDEFDTTSGYYTPYIKYAGDDSQNNWNPMFYFRCSTSEDTPGNQIIIGNISWYGVVGHACNYSSFSKTSISDPYSGVYKHGWACNAVGVYEHTFEWYRGCFRIRTNVNDTEDSLWTYKNGDGKVECKKGPSLNTSTFYLYIGYPKASSAISGTFEAPAGITTTLKNVVLNAGARIVVGKNAYVVIDGSKNITNGDIVVDGGVLVVKGVLDTSVQTGTSEYGSVTVENGGALIIEDTGLLVTRDKSSNLTVTGSSVMVVAGTCSIAGKITIDNSSFFAREGSALIHGAYVIGDVEASEVSKEKVFERRTAYLSCFISNFGSSDAVGGLEVTDNSTFEVNGLYYRGNTNTTTVGNSNVSASYKAHTNVNSTVGAMVLQW